MEPNLDADLSAMSVDQLLDYQQAVTRLRLAAIDAGRRAQSELDGRVREIAERRRAEDALLGQSSKPPTQQVFGEPS